MQSSAKLVLVTGANGYVGTHVVGQLLQQGYGVRAAIRSQKAADKMSNVHAKYKDNLTCMIVPDITIKGAFDEAVKGVHGVMHLATPYNFGLADNEKDVLDPAIKGTETILESVHAHGSTVKRVIITSSFAAIFDPTKGLNPGYVYTETDWSPISYNAARDGDAFTAYFGAKLLAEKAAWNLMERLRLSSKPPKFDITVLNPPVIYGPSAQPLNFDALGTSTGDINRLIDGSSTDVPEPAFWPFVDVRDVATAHIRALETAAAGGQRFLLAGSMFSYQQVCDTLRASDRIPEAEKAKIPVGKPGQDYPGANCYTADASKSKSVLGMEYFPLEKCVVDAVLDIIEKRKSKEL